MSDDSTYYTETTTYSPSTEAAPVFDTSAYDSSATVVDSSSYDSTSWSDVAAESQVYTDAYNAQSDASWELWNAATDAYVAGDTEASYELTQASYAMESAADASWDASYDTWATSAETTVVTTYETPADTWSASSYDTSSYDTSSYDTSSSWSASSDVSTDV